MDNEELTPRVANLENQINMMAGMMAEMKAMMTAAREKAPEANPTTSIDSGAIQTTGTESEKEVPHKAPPLVIDLEQEKKEKPPAKTEEGARRLAKIEECLNSQGYELARFDKISPFTKIEVPVGYKEPEFVRKYDGTGCPRAHLRYYLRKMAHYSDYVPLLMNTFQESLSGAALAWFIELDMEEYDGWEDLAEDFLHQYKFNTATAPTREDLLRTTKGRNETIRTFAQRWRAIATQVKPAIPEEELVDLFLKTLPLEYFERLNTSGCQTFAHLVKVAERHEWALREKRIPEPSFKRQYPARRDNSGDVAFVPNPPAPKKFSESTPTPGGPSGQVPRKFEAKKRSPPSFTPLPRPLSKLLPMLLEGHLVAKEPPRPNPPRFPGFDETKSCVYHMGEKGHNVDNCLVLKYKVQALIDGGLLEFDKAEPNVQQNPLPDHGGVNAIWDEGDVDELEYTADTAKLQEILEVAATYPADREASREEKRECIAKLAALGIIDRTGDATANGVPLRIDLSAEEFRVEADDRNLGEVPREHGPNEKRVTEESDEEPDDEEIRRRRAHQVDKEFLQRALERGDIVDTLGQDSGGYNYRVLYSPPPWFFAKTEQIVPDGWGGMDDPVDGEELAGAVDEATPSQNDPAEEECSPETQERLVNLERGMDRMASMVSELSRAVANVRVTPVERKYEVLELKRAIDWQNRRFAELEEYSKDLASTVAELKAIITRGGRRVEAGSGSAVARDDLTHITMEKDPDQTRTPPEPWCPDYDSDHINEDELIAVIGTKAPFVIKLDEVDGWESVKSSPSERMVVSLSGLKLKDEEPQSDSMIEKVVIKVPPPAVYDPKAVPWDYETGEIGAVMRSGRCYAPREGEPEKKAVTREDAERAVSIVRTSEFEVIEQLRKMPAQISLLDLFTNSEKHKNALMKVLNEASVPETISEVQLEDFVGSILLKDQISFSDEDVPVDGWAHNKALYISVRSHGKQISHVLIDNGSAFNICPLATLRNMGVNEELIRTSKATIRAFDGMRKSVVGEIELDVLIGPVNFSIGFQVMDLPSAFGLLLGRPWIHTAGAVPSSLHQKVRFVVNGKAITVHGETDLAAYQRSAVPHIEPERKEEASYHSFDLVAVVHAPPKAKRMIPAPSQYTLAPGKILLAYGFVPGRGLGKDGQGIRSPLQLGTNGHRAGLGYTGEANRGFTVKGRGRGRKGGRGSQGGRAGSFIGSRAWKGKASAISSPLNQYFSERPKMLADETIQNEAEPDLTNPFLEDTVNVILEQLDEETNQPV